MVVEPARVAPLVIGAAIVALARKWSPWSSPLPVGERPKARSTTAAPPDSPYGPLIHSAVLLLVLVMVPPRVSPPAVTTVPLAPPSPPTVRLLPPGTVSAPRVYEFPVPRALIVPVAPVMVTPTAKLV